MTEITFLASSKPFKIPTEIQQYNQRTVFATEEDFMFFTVHEAVDSWLQEIQGVFSLPYIYEAEGIGNRLFLKYIEEYMEIGDVLEVYHVPNQHAFLRYKEKMQSNPEPIEVNTGTYTYRDSSGFYQLNPKKWVEELSHRNYITEHGVTTFVKY